MARLQGDRSTSCLAEAEVGVAAEVERWRGPRGARGRPGGTQVTAWRGE